MVLPVLYVLRYSDWLDLQYCKSYREFSHLQLMVNVVAAMVASRNAQGQDQELVL